MVGGEEGMETKPVLSSHHFPAPPMSPGPLDILPPATDPARVMLVTLSVTLYSPPQTHQPTELFTTESDEDIYSTKAHILQ